MRQVALCATDLRRTVHAMKRQGLLCTASAALIDRRYESPCTAQHRDRVFAQDDRISPFEGGAYPCQRLLEGDRRFAKTDRKWPTAADSVAIHSVQSHFQGPAVHSSTDGPPGLC